MSSLIQNIIILGGIVVVMGLGYFLYTQNVGLNAGNDDVSMQVTAENTEFLRRLNELKAIELRGDIFADPRFISLLNFSAPIISEPIGTDNPFAQDTTN